MFESIVQFKIDNGLTFLKVPGTVEVPHPSLLNFRLIIEYY